MEGVFAGGHEVVRNDYLRSGVIRTHELYYTRDIAGYARERERDTVIAEFLGIAFFLLLLYIGDYLFNSLLSDRSVARDTRICQRWLLQLGDCTML